jgi:UDP-glucose 4-epimerase
MRVLVTGATGFVGANLVRQLIEREDIGVFITARTTSDFWRLKGVVDRLKGICYLNLAEKSQVYDMVKSIKPNIIFHLSTYGGFPGQVDKQTMISANLLAAVNLVDAAIELGVEQFINTGSSSEYGIKSKPMREDDVCEPVNFYGVTKLAATNYCTMVGKSQNYRICTLRLFSPYGAYEDPARLYPTILDALRKGSRPKLSKPDSVRDFIEVEKVAAVYLEIIKADYAPGDIINVGSGSQQTIRQFYDSIREKYYSDIEPFWGEAASRTHEPQMWQADIDKLRRFIV